MPEEPKVNVGISVERLPKRGSIEPLSFVEVVTRSRSLPKPAPLARWRADNPNLEAAIAIPLQDSLELSDDLRRWIEKATDALQACALVVPTSARVTPTDRSRRHLGDLAGSLTLPSNCLAVWAPGGVWEPEEATALGNGSGLSVARDPLQHTTAPAAGRPQYLRVHAHGTQSRLSEGALGAVADQVQQGGAETYIVIHSSRASSDAQRLAQMLGQEQSAAP